MKVLSLYIKIAVLCLMAQVAKAQMDPHFSQYYAYPLWLNPGLTGVIDADARITGNFRDQWTGIGNGFKSVAISGDFRHSDKVALGLNVLSQKVGTAGYNYLSAQASFAYKLSLSSDSYHKLSMGVQAGLINRSFDASRLQMDDQYNPATGFDPSIVSADNFTESSASVFDASSGIFYYDGTPDARANLFAGFSVAHLSSGEDSFGNQQLNSTIPRRYTLHGGIRLYAADFLDITPHVIYIKQRESKVQAAGLNFELNLKADYSLMIGGMYRLNDAAVANVGLYIKDLVVGLSYDYTTSPLRSGGAGAGYEFSIGYIFKPALFAKKEKCPRL